MKKTLLKSILLFALSAIVLTSCGGKEPVAIDQNVQTAYFTIDDANYHDGNQPSGAEDLLSEVQLNSTVISGGSSILRIVSQKQLDNIFVGVKGVRGYYEVAFEQTRASESEFAYEAILLIRQNIVADKFVVNVSATDTDGVVSKIYESAEVGMIAVGNGALQVSLSWDQQDDVDLHVMVYDPQKDNRVNEVYFGNRFILDSGYSEYDLEFDFLRYVVNVKTGLDTSNYTQDQYYELDDLYSDLNLTDDEALHLLKQFAASNARVIAFLDLDSNAGCDIDGVRNENIYFKRVESEYIYIVAVDLWEKCGSGVGAKFAVTTHYKGNRFELPAPVGEFADNDYGSGDSESRYKIVGAFKIVNDQPVIVEVPESRSGSSIFAPTTNVEKIIKKQRRCVTK